MQTDRSDASTERAQKLNKKFRNDLKNLEKVADLSFINQDKIRIKSASKSPRKPLQPALPNKIDLTKELINEHEKLNLTNPGKAKLKPLISQDKHAVDLLNSSATQEAKHVAVRDLPSKHKYPLSNEQYVSVQELKNKVYKSTLGVLPVRQSQKLKELNFIMKGRPIKNKQAKKMELFDDDDSADRSDDGEEEEEDEEEDQQQASQDQIEDKEEEEDEDEEESSEDESEYYNKIHANLNTPVTSAIGDGGLSYAQTPLYVFKTNFDFGLKDTARSTAPALPNKKTKPAILAATGTAGQAKFSERPRPPKKDTTLVVKSSRKQTKQTDTGSQEVMRKNASAADLQQAELESEMKHLINEARNIAGSGKSVTPSRSKKPKVETPTAAEQQVKQAQNENLLLSTVEGLISAIKSGQIIRQQEVSNNRIKDILVSILDKETFETFENIFEKNKVSFTTDSERLMLEEALSMTTASEVERNLAALSSENLLKEELKKSATRLTATESKSNREESVSLLLESSTKHTHRTATSYEDEVNAYLASLPAEVTRTDVLNAQAKKVKMFEKAVSEHKNLKLVKELSAEEKYAKNLHLFCMFEHERRRSLLLPDELVNVTRKFHTKNKFESHLIYSGRNALSREASMSSIKKMQQSASKKETHTATVEEAARRVFSKLTNTVQFDEHLRTPRKMDELRQMNDSGFLDASLESWRLQAESTLGSDFCLEAHKMELSENELIVDPSLRFLRPAPPKMSIRPAEIRKNLYPAYASFPPLDLNAIIPEKKTMSASKSNSKSVKRNKLKTKTINYSDFDSDDSDFLDETLSTQSHSESALLLDRMLKRQYNSETDIRRLAKDSQTHKKKRTFDGFSLQLKRTLSDALIYDTLKKDKSDEFVKIDSNYSDALDEAMYQKDRIKKEYLKKKLEEQLEKRSSEQDNSSTETKTEKIEEKTEVPEKPQDENYFPKAVYRDLAKEAADADRNYIVKEKKKGKKTLKKKPVQKLNQNLLDQIRVEMLSKNRVALARSESISRIKFPVRVNHPDDLIIRVPRTLIEQKRPSAPSLFDFEEYKREHEFEIELGDREWTRKIWNIWFDEVIPQLDGTGGRPASALEDRRANREQGHSQLSKANTVGVSRQQNHTAAKDDQEEEEEDTNPEEKKSNAKSPTPYDTFAKINLYDDESELKENQLDAIHFLESEIEKLTQRLSTKLSAFDLTRRGTFYRKLGYLAMALEDLDRASEIEPNFVDAFWQRHLVFLTQNKKNEALQDLQVVLKLNRTHSGAYISIANLYAERNDLAAAISNYSNAIKYDPQNYMAYFKRAQLYENRGETRMAMDDYLSTTRINPKFYDAWFRHGMNYYDNGNWNYALVDFTELIANCPKNQSEARLYRGKCNLNLGEHQEALNDFSVALHLNPNDWQSYYHRGCLLRKIDTKQSLQDLSVSLMIENGYDNINSFLHRGIIYAESERYDEAIKDFESALELDKEFAPAYCNLGIIYMNVSMNYWKAIRNFNNAIKSDPVYLRAYLCRAQAYRCVHNLKRAYIDYTKAIHLDPLNTQVYIYRGQVIYEMGDAKLASFCVQHAAFMNEGMNDKASKPARVETGRSSRPQSHTRKSNMTQSDDSASAANQSVTQRAVVFSFLKNFSKAISVLEYELKIKPVPEIYNLLGRVFMKAKRLNDAVNSFDQSIECVLEMIGVKGLKKNIQSYSKLNMSKEYQLSLIEALTLKGQCLLDLASFQEAYNSFDKIIEMQPNNAYAYYNRGMARYHLNHQKCIQDFNKALSINPKLFEAFLGRACVYGLKDRFTKATLNCNEAAKICPKSVRAYLYRGALKYLSRSYEPSLIDLTKAIELDQTCAIAYFNRALCYHKLKRFKHSLKDYSTVLLLGEYLKYKVYINRGLLYFELEGYSNALKDFLLAAEFDPSNLKIQQMIGFSLHKLGKYREAVDKLTETYDKNPKFYDAIISRGNAYVDFGTPEAFHKAQRDFELVLLKDPKNLDAHINLSYLLQMTGSYMKAWNQFTEALEIYPNNVQLYEGRSVVCLQMSDTDAALKDINKAIKLKPSAELYVNRGVIYQFMADNLNAMRDYQAAILIDANYGLAYYNSANILLLHRQFSQAIQMLDLAIEKCNMKDESTYQNRAIAKAFNQDAPGAFRDLCEALKHDQYSAHIYMNRALLLFKMENYKLAEKDLTTAINLSPDDALLYKIRADCRGKLEMKEDAINDYKVFVDLNDRNEITKNLKRKQIKY